MWLLLALLLKLINFNLNFLRVLLILLPVMVLINLFDYLIRVPMINHYGIETRGTVTSVENTSVTLNFNSVKRHRVRYTLVDGRPQEASFLNITDDYYPRDGSVRIPRQGGEFKLKYLPQKPKYFILLGES